MNTSHTAPPPSSTPALGASLRRTSGDRVLLGLCGGIARSMGASPLAIRIATIALAVVLLPLVVAAYLGTALIVPRDDGSALIGPGTRDRRDIIVVLLALLIAAPLVLGTATTSIFGGFTAWPAILVGSIVAFVLAVWRPKALFGGAAEAPTWSPAQPASPASASDTPATTAYASAAGTVTGAAGDPFHGTVTGPYPDVDPGEADTIIVGSRSDEDPTAVQDPANGPSFVKQPSEPTGGPDFVKPTTPPAPPVAAPRRPSIALPILSVLTLIPAIFVVLVAVGLIDSVWDAWSVMFALMAVGAAAGAVAIALLRPSYLGAGLLVVLAAFLGAGSIALNQFGPVLDDGVGTRSFVPTTPADLPARYTLGVGELNLDLRQLALAPGARITVHTKIGFGQVRIMVPKGVRVVGAPGTDVPGLVTTATRNGASMAASRNAPVIALDVQARGGEIDLLGGTAVHYENMTVLSSQTSGFWGTTDNTSQATGRQVGVTP